MASTEETNCESSACEGSEIIASSRYDAVTVYMLSIEWLAKKRASELELGSETVAVPAERSATCPTKSAS